MTAINPAGSANEESFHALGWVLDHADAGFYLFTASSLMQRHVAEHYQKYNIAIYDYSKNAAPYRFSTLAQWANVQQSKIFFVINMQVALHRDDDIFNLNMSRDLLSQLGGIWIFGMDSSTDTRLSRLAYDIYSFMRVRSHFEDQGIEKQPTAAKFDRGSLNEYYKSYADAQEQMARYAAMLDELMALPLDSGQEYLLISTITLSNIARLYSSYARYDEALEILSRVLLIREKLLGAEHLDTADSYNDVACIYSDQGDYAKALEYHQKSLKIRESVLGIEHPNTALSYNSIGLVYSAQGDYVKALEYHQKAFKIYESVLGIKHLNTAISYNNIGLVYSAQGDYVKALEYYQKSLEIRESVLGAEHPDTASSYNNIATVYDAQGNYAKALEYHQKALKIREHVLGAEHSDTAMSYNNIATVYDAQGDYAKALEYAQKAVKIRESVLGAEHPNTASSYNNLANV
ncbi:MAG: tetratricopeptide repeat protein, partial [Deferribacteraceae bacterium]|nr:tetratricopeptide repeat protein [Deferribacteraceae bacterium]